MNWFSVLGLVGLTVAANVEVILDARSPLTREVYGSPETKTILTVDQEYVDNIQSKVKEEDLTAAVLLVDDASTEESCNLVPCFDDLEEYVNSSYPQKIEISYPEDLSFEGLKKSLELERILLIDVRNRSELVDPGQIPGSVNLPLHEIPQAFELSPQQFEEKYNFTVPEPLDRNIVLTCRSGKRILVAKERMEALGYEYLRLYRGSFNDWVANGGDII
ncbi:thiosulfate sulfurtransferase/rhodanese-like domain-containing protein 3 [Eurytemora carolleeae]|uniref:thiosulfate sulfurtransferase/rhodanese-like domain-containing protein 3 n=1 Tax=Eurytemora carolleeae TaxID=1294199 RepID=UPI000C7922BD|nr:thiosulfate sulfurtransferase/rhodanese-like domain-containing protein 3 [Eurytemora carolleeae]|eukprot:XP_023336817.1 thiosulfate sulfurtransferase/rhodanese-like domain-containing protein 3 [Eurytemora affinis]